MTSTFLQHTATYLSGKHGEDYRRVLVLTPNRRAGLFLQKELQALSDKPIWAPVMMTMDEWVRHHSSQVEADRLSAIYALYELWNAYFNTREPFENFYFWGQRLLDDFDQIDKYLVSVEKLFSNLSDERKIEEQFSGWKEELLDYLRQFWSSLPEGSENTNENLAQFYNLWAALPTLKAQLDRRLAAEGTAYSGQMYRQLAENLDFDTDWADFEIYFVGFNRLNRCEQRIMDRLKETHGAEAIWNVEKNLSPRGAYHNAGMYLRHIRDGENSNRVFTHDWSAQPKSVSLTGMQKKVAQAKWIGEQLAKQLEIAPQTMIVLPDEQMLLPLLSALPESIQEVNVSMGVSLSETPALSLLSAFLELHQNYDANLRVYRTEDVQRLIEHPYMPPAARLNFDHARMRSDALAGDLPGALKPFFEPLSPEQPAALFDHLLAGLAHLHAYHEERTDTSVGLAEYISEVLVFTHQRIQKLADIYRTQSMQLEIDALRQLVRDYFRNARIPFQGEPLKGLQILGPLEARNLDYPKLFIPNLNEGVMPRGGDTSLIPFHLKKAFGMPVVDDEVAESAYYFFMALSRAEDIHLMYNQSMDVLGAREISRFAQSLELFKPDNWSLEKGLQVQEVQPIPQEAIEIEKTSEILAAIRADLQRGLSPSKLNTILSCHLKYYRHYISKIKEEMQTDRSYSALNIGNLLHKLMEELYGSYEKKTVTAEIIEHLQAAVEPTLQRLMMTELMVDADQLDRGELLLLFHYVKQGAEHILAYDKKIAPFVMEEHEKSIEGLKIPMDIDGLEHIKINGKIDRVDIHQGYYRFSDYKTGLSGFQGRQAAEIKPFPDMMEPGQRDYHSLAIQLGIYAFAHRESGLLQDRSGIQISHYVLPEMHDPSTYDHRFHFKNSDPLDTLDEQYDDIRAGLTAALSALLDPDQPIVQTPHTQFCAYCPFKQLCKRQDAGHF